MPAPLFRCQEREGNIEICSTQYVILVRTSYSDMAIRHTTATTNLQPKFTKEKYWNRSKVKKDDLSANHFIRFGNKIEIQYTINYLIKNINVIS